MDVKEIETSLTANPEKRKTESSPSGTHCESESVKHKKIRLNKWESFKVPELKEECRKRSLKVAEFAFSSARCFMLSRMLSEYSANASETLVPIRSV